MTEQRGDQDLDVGEMSHVRVRTPEFLVREGLGRNLRELVATRRPIECVWLPETRRYRAGHVYAPTLDAAVKAAWKEIAP